MAPGWAAQRRQAFGRVGLALTGLAASSLTELALSQNLIRQRTARAALAGAGALTISVLGAWAMGGAALAGALRGEPRLAEHLAPAVPAILAALYAWWQGEHLGRSPVGNQALRATFNNGILALAPLLFLNSLLAIVPGEKVLGALMLFFGLGLGGLALSSLRHLRVQQASGRLMALALSRQWLATSTAVIGLVLGAGLLAARLAAPATLTRLATALTGLLDQTAYALGLVLGPLAGLLDRLLAPGLPGLSAFLERFITLLSIASQRLQGLVALVALVSLRRGGHGGRAAAPGLPGLTGLSSRRALGRIAVGAGRGGDCLLAGGAAVVGAANQRRR